MSEECHPRKPEMSAHSETKRLPYTADQMYDLVGDVAKYPKFLPWTAAARIRSQVEHGDHVEMLADLVISFKVFRETFGDAAVYCEPNEVIYKVRELWADPNAYREQAMKGYVYVRKNADQNVVMKRLEGLVQRCTMSAPDSVA